MNNSLSRIMKGLSGCPVYLRLSVYPGVEDQREFGIRCDLFVANRPLTPPLAGTTIPRDFVLKREDRQTQIPLFADTIHEMKTGFSAGKRVFGLI